MPSELTYQLRFAVPLWLIRVLFDWMPDNRVAIRIRGAIVSAVIGSGHGLTVGRDVTLLSAHRLTIGSDVYLAKGSWVNAIGGVVIEDQVVLAPYVVVSSSNHGFREGSVRFGGAHPAPVHIGRGSWIASHATITAGSIVGKGNLVGANTVVSGTTPDHVVVGGVPGTILGPRRDNPSTIVSKAQA